MDYEVPYFIYNIIACLHASSSGALPLKFEIHMACKPGNNPTSVLHLCMQVPMVGEEENMEAEDDVEADKNTNEEVQAFTSSYLSRDLVYHFFHYIGPLIEAAYIRPKHLFTFCC